MKTIDDYLDDLRLKESLTSDRQVDKILGFTGASTCHWRKKKTLPAPETMVRLAKLGGNDPREALLELHLWQCQSRQEYGAAKIYAQILAQIKNSSSVAAMLVFFLFPAALERTVNYAQPNSPHYTLCDNGRYAKIIMDRLLFSLHKEL